MSLDKAIKHGKEKRKRYYGAKAADPSCARGDCPWCRGNKLHKHRRRNCEPQLTRAGCTNTVIDKLEDLS
jgi:hypothetical protein